MTTALIYTRQSKHRDESITHELQEQACRNYAASKGYEVLTVLNEKGKSGTSIAKRKEFKSAVKMIKSKQAEVLLVWRWSRFARNTLDGLITLKTIEEEAGGRVECATEPIDKSAMGKFNLTMMLGMAELESAVKGEQWKEALEYRIAKGLPPGGRRYWGYDRIEADKKTGVEEHYVINEDVAKYIREAIDRITNGQSIRATCHWLNEEGIRTPLGKTLSPAILRRSLSNPFLRGRINWKGAEVDGSHQPIITEAQFQKFLKRVSENKAAPRSAVPSHRLVGVVFCAKCNRRMSYFGPKKDRPNSVPNYRCATRVAKGSSACDTPYIKVSLITDALEWWMPRHQKDITKAAPEESDLTEKIEEQELEVDRLQTKLTETLTIGTEAGLSAAQMADALKTINNQIEAARSESEALKTQISLSQSRWWDIEDIIHGDDVIAAREMLRKILNRIEYSHETNSLTFIPTVGEPYEWSLKSGPSKTSGWTI